MKKIVFLVSLFLVIACQERKQENKPDQKIKLSEADTSSNETVHLTDLEGNYSALDEVIAQHKGQVVYLDIWASWCGPCKVMMPYSERLQKEYKGQDVAFMYMSIDTKEAQWQAASKRFGLLQQSYLAHNYPKASLFQENNVNSIPRYMLFDKKGRLIDDNARRPSDPELKTTINALLSL